MIVLDTHVWVWWLSSPDKIPPRVRTLLAESSKDSRIYISSISAWEILMLAGKGRLQFSVDAHDWVEKAEALPFLHFVPIDNTIAMRSVRLSEPFHKDPADRIIVATSIILGAALVTADARMRKYPHVKTIWR